MLIQGNKFFFKKCSARCLENSALINLNFIRFRRISSELTLMQPKTSIIDHSDNDIYDDARSCFSSTTSLANNRNRQRRTSIEPRQAKFNFKSLVTILKNASLGEYSLPISAGFNEPISYLQKSAEGFQFSHLLDKAATYDHGSTLEQMVYVAAFMVAYGSVLYNRTAKPFTPLLNETYECDRTQDGDKGLGWRYMSEYYNHYPTCYASVFFFCYN